VTKQWTAKWPDTANAVFRIAKNDGEKTGLFWILGGAIAPTVSPLDLPLFAALVSK